MADMPVDYESLRDLGAIMGSGGLVVLDNRDCMVDMARYFLRFTQAESCGKCAPCRIGTKRMLEILDRLATGKAKPNELAALEDLAGQVKSSSLCGLGQTAPNPVLSTLRYFRAEYEAHLQGRAPAALRRPGEIRRQRRLRRLHALRPGMPNPGHRVHALPAAHGRCRQVHPLRRLPAVCPAAAIEVMS